MTHRIKSYPFLPEDAWKKASVDKSIQVILSLERQKRLQKVNESVQLILNSKLNPIK